MTKRTKIYIGAIISFILSIVVNYGASTLPLNNITPAEVSFLYFNLFTPATYAFSIWGVIYLMVFIFLVAQLPVIKANENSELAIVLDRVNILFIVLNLVNCLWIVSWHYDLILLSTILMVMLLYLLILIKDTFKTIKLGLSDYFKYSVAFSLYLGWICIATIANFAVLLVYYGIEPFGAWQTNFTAILLFIGFLLALLVGRKYRDPFIIGVFIWAYVAIGIQHINQGTFNSTYPTIITSVVICVWLLTLYLLYIIWKHK